jgi:hypothetical protein
VANPTFHILSTYRNDARPGRRLYHDTANRPGPIGTDPIGSINRNLQELCLLHEAVIWIVDNDVVFAFIGTCFTPIARHNTTIAYGTPVMGTHLFSSILFGHADLRVIMNLLVLDPATPVRNFVRFFLAPAQPFSFTQLRTVRFVSVGLRSILALLSLKNLAANPLFNTIEVDRSPRIVYSLEMPSFLRRRHGEVYDHGTAGPFEPAYRLDPGLVARCWAHSKATWRKSRSHGANRSGLQAMPG